MTNIMISRYNKLNLIQLIIGIEVIMLAILDNKNFDKVYRIMLDSFPKDEIRSYEKQQELLGKKCYKIFTLNDVATDEIKAFIATYDFDGFLFAEHFAVDKKHRNQGLGSVILNELIAITDKPICLEVEVPNTPIACRRIEFYKRNGFYSNEYPYIQPAIEQGKQPVPLFIMSTNRKLNALEFESVKSTLYKEVYHQ